MGESVSEGSIVEWRAHVGQWIEAGATLVEVTTDKVDVEVPAPLSGLVTKVLASEGATVAVGAALAEIDPAGEKPADVPAAEKSAEPKAPSPAAPAVPSKNGSAVVGKPGGAATHQARRLAEREHLDLSTIRGTGPDALITRDDVLRAASSPGEHRIKNGPPQPLLPPLSESAKVTTLKGPSASLVSYMEQSLTMPTATSFRTLGVGPLEARRAELNGALKAAGRSEKISFTHLIAFALVRAAREQPAIAATFRRDGDVLQRVESGIHLGIAVDAQRKDGTRFLVVPVIKDADALDFAAFRAAYEELIVKARDGKLTADELTGATITLTNPGGIGTVASVPRLLAGQAAIIAAGAIGYPAGFTKSNETSLRQLGVEKVMTLTSTYDHRVIQGAQSGEYLRRVDELLGGADEFYDAIFSSFDLRAALTPPDLPVRAPSHAGETTGAPSAELFRAIASAMMLVSAFRRHGHLAATLDPLGTPPQGDPSLSDRTAYIPPLSSHLLKPVRMFASISSSKPRTRS